MITREQALNLLWQNPIEIGHWVGFRDLTALHNEWLRSFLYYDKDQTLQGHRGSYKTTTLSLFFAISMIIYPNKTILFFRKTDRDVVEIMRQTSKIFKAGCTKQIVNALYRKQLILEKDSGYEINTNLSTSIRGTSQLVGLGLGTSITGKHADIVVTDDIVNINDRISAAERNRTKTAYMELQNIKNRGGRLINTGTPWHKDDAFTLMPSPKKYDCYSSGLMTAEQISDLRMHMSPSLFAANYELRHIAAENVMFADPVINAPMEKIRGGIAHLDSAYYGEDYTAFSIMTFHDGKYYLFGKIWRRHVEDCYPEIFDLYNQHLCDKLYTENNADKGLVARDLKNMGIRVSTYVESMNKHIKISAYLKAIWPELEFVTGTDAEYIEQILDYNENAEHDDAPDSAACLARMFYKRHYKRRSEADYDYVSGLI